MTTQFRRRRMLKPRARLNATTIYVLLDEAYFAQAFPVASTQNCAGGRPTLVVNR